MNLLDLKKHNSIAIYNCIRNGINTLSSITEATGISKITVSTLTIEMQRREIILVNRPKVDRHGRRTNVYEASRNYFCYFIEKLEDHFSVIAIDTSGYSIDRFDYKLNFGRRSENSILNDCILRIISRRPNYQYCMAIYLLGDDIEKLEPTLDVIKISKEHLIAMSLANQDTTSLFEFDNQIIISLYSHLQFPSVDKGTLCKIIKFDEIYSFVGKLYFECFDSLQRIAIKNLEKII